MSTTKPKKTGRPPKKIDTTIVEALAGIGCTMEEIGVVVGCSVDTLERRFADVIKKGRGNFTTSVRREQWKHAQKGNPALLIWLGKQYLNQKDEMSLEHVHKKRESARERLAGRIAGVATRLREKKDTKGSD